MPASVPLFTGCSEKGLSAVSAIADAVYIDSGKAVVIEGDRGRELFVMVAGSANVTRAGRRIAMLGAGDIVGAMPLVTDTPRDARATATSGLRILAVTDPDFRRLMRDVPSIAPSVLEAVAQRVSARESSTWRVSQGERSCPRPKRQPRRSVVSAQSAAATMIANQTTPTMIPIHSNSFISPPPRLSTPGSR